MRFSLNLAEAPADGKWSWLCLFSMHPAQTWPSLSISDLIPRLLSKSVHHSVRLSATWQPFTPPRGLSPAFWNDTISILILLSDCWVCVHSLSYVLPQRVPDTVSKVLDKIICWDSSVVISAFPTTLTWNWGTRACVMSPNGPPKLSQWSSAEFGSHVSRLLVVSICLCVNSTREEDRPGDFLVHRRTNTMCS